MREKRKQGEGNESTVSQPKPRKSCQSPEMEIVGCENPTPFGEILDALAAVLIDISESDGTIARPKV